ncbi:MAG: PepSY domain-containing protein [Methanobacterium sp.]
MERKFIALIVIIVVIIAGAAYVLGAQNSSIPSIAVNNSTASKDISTTTYNPSKNSNQTNPSIKISASQAQQIAVGAAEELGGQKVKAGTPTLFKWTANNKHTWVWNVPLTYVSTGKSAGYMYVDAITGTVIMNE